MPDRSSRTPLRACAGEGPPPVGITVDGENFLLASGLVVGEVLEEVASALAGGRTATFALSGGGTLVLNGARVRTVVVDPTDDEEPAPRRALLDP